MSWFKDSLFTKEENSISTSSDPVAAYSIDATSKVNPYTSVVMDIDDFEEIEIEIISLEDGKVNVSTSKLTNVS